MIHKEFVFDEPGEAFDREFRAFCRVKPLSAKRLLNQLRDASNDSRRHADYMGGDSITDTLLVPRRRDNDHGDVARAIVEVKNGIGVASEFIPPGAKVTRY